MDSGVLFEKKLDPDIDFTVEKQFFFIFQEDYCEGRYLSSGQAGRGPVYSCEDCDKTFASPGKLRQHEYTHTGETPFECSIPGQKKNFKGTFILLQSFSGCDKKFTSKFKLKRHILIHSQTKTFLLTNLHCTHPAFELRPVPS